MNKDKFEYDILNGKKYKRLLLAYINHIKNLSGSDLLDIDCINASGLSKADAIELTIIQKIKD